MWQNEGAPQLSPQKPRHDFGFQIAAWDDTVPTVDKNGFIKIKCKNATK